MKNNLIYKRLSKTRKVGLMLSCLPFVRCVILNGSLASGGHKEASDIDILIIAKNGRIFTARFIVNIIALVFRIKRPKDEFKSHAGKFCFNYFLTEKFLAINCPDDRREYCALNYSKSKFTAGNRKLFNEFMLVNKELFEKYSSEITKTKLSASASQGRDGQISNKLQNSNFQILNSVKSLPECFLTDWFEKWAKNYQIKKIESDPRTKRHPSLIVYNDQELRFHPPKATENKSSKE